MKTIKYLYRELLKQQKICGIVFAIFGALALFATLLIYAVSEPSIVPYQLFNPYAYFVMIAGGIAFPIVGFSYQYHRNSSDIMHSIPASRKQLFAATAAAVFTWLSALLLATYLVSLVGYLLMGQAFSLIQAISELLNMWIASLTMAAGTMIAISITGSALSALAASLVINFVPRLVLTMIAGGVSGNNMLMLDGLGILSPQYNLTFGPWLGLMFSAIFAHSTTETTHILTAFSPVGLPFFYTGLLFALYLFAAVKLFERRKSETAGHASSGKLAQACIRLGLASPFVIMLGMMSARWGFEFDETYFWIILLCAFAVYMIYELLSRRSFKKIFTTLPMLIVMVVVLLGTAGVSEWAGDVIASRTVSADEIRWVAFDGDNDQMYPTDNEYTNAKYGLLRYDDPQIKAIIAENMEETVLEKEDPINYHRNYESMMNLRVKIGAGLGSFVRYIEMPYSDYVQLLELTQTDAKALERYDAYPTSDQVKSLHYSGNVEGLDDNELKALWDLAVEEYQSLSEAEKRAYASENSSYYYYTEATREHATQLQKQSSIHFGRINATGAVGGKIYTVGLRINAMLPKTAARMFAYAENQLNIEQISQMIAEDRLSDEPITYEWGLEYTDPEGYGFSISSESRYGMDDEYYKNLEQMVKDGYYADIETALAKERNFQYLPEGQSVLDYMKENVRVDHVYEMVAEDERIEEIAEIFASGKAVDPILDGGYYTLNINCYSKDGWWQYRTVYFSIEE